MSQQDITIYTQNDGFIRKTALFHRHRTVSGPYDRISNVNENKTDSYIYIVCLKVETDEPCMNERKCVIIWGRH